MAIVIQTTAPVTPPTNLNVANMKITAYSQPTSVFNGNSASPSVLRTFNNGSPLAIGPTQSNYIPPVTTLKVGSSLGTSPVGSSSIVATSPSSSTGTGWQSVLQSVATNAVNLGANVLLNKISPTPSSTNTTSPSNPNGQENNAPTPIVIYDPAASGQQNADATSNFLNTLLGAFVAKQTSPSGEVTSVQPSMNGYFLIAGIILLVILFMGRK